MSVSDIVKLCLQLLGSLYVTLSLVCLLLPRNWKVTRLLARIAADIKLVLPSPPPLPTNGGDTEITKKRAKERAVVRMPVLIAFAVMILIGIAIYLFELVEF